MRRRAAACKLGTGVRHRLNHGVDPRTRAHVARRSAEGLSKREIIRCLKRYVARKVHHHLTVPPLRG